MRLDLGAEVCRCNHLEAAEFLRRFSDPPESLAFEHVCEVAVEGIFGVVVDGDLAFVALLFADATRQNVEHSFVVELWRVHEVEDVVDEVLLDDFVDQVFLVQTRRTVHLDQPALERAVDQHIVAQQLEGVGLRSDVRLACDEALQHQQLDLLPNLVW